MKKRTRSLPLRNPKGVFLPLGGFEISMPTSGTEWFLPSPLKRADRASVLRGRRLAGGGARGWGAISISAKPCQASAIWCTLSGEVINLVSLALVVCHQPLFCSPCPNAWI